MPKFSNEIKERKVNITMNKIISIISTGKREKILTSNIWSRKGILINYYQQFQNGLPLTSPVQAHECSKPIKMEIDNTIMRPKKTSRWFWKLVPKLQNKVGLCSGGMVFPLTMIFDENVALGFDAQDVGGSGEDHRLSSG